MEFQDLTLIEPLLRALSDEGYSRPTPVQSQAIPHVLQGRDLLGCAQTGTGKTAAFALPILQLMAQKPRNPRPGARPIRTLVLTPTRELASQIAESFSCYGRHLNSRTAVIYGGVGQGPQTKALRRGPDVVVATPGRLLDLMNQGYVSLRGLEIFVLDEADRMLDMGFIHDVRKVLAVLPRRRQTLLFSATLAGDIRTLARDILTEPVRVDITPEVATPEKIGQSVYYVDKSSKGSLLIDVLADPEITRALVFSRTKHGANRLVRQLEKTSIPAVAIHGNKSQTAREKALEGFKQGKTRVLIATDIAARGIDVEEITHVINFDIPEVAETYVHRIGRTARAGAEGLAISFCTGAERADFANIERLIGFKVSVISNHGYPAGGSGGGAPRRGRAPAPRPGSRSRSAAPAQSGRPRSVAPAQSGRPARRTRRRPASART